MGLVVIYYNPSNYGSETMTDLAYPQTTALYQTENVFNNWASNVATMEAYHARANHTVIDQTNEEDQKRAWDLQKNYQFYLSFLS